MRSGYINVSSNTLLLL